MRPDSGDICICGHSFGSHSRDTLGPCLALHRNADTVAASGEDSCRCPHWRQPIQDMAGELSACIEAEAAIAESNPAAHDAWQLALQHLEPLRAAIDRARRVGGNDV